MSWLRFSLRTWQDQVELKLLVGLGFRGGQLTMAVARGCLDPLHLHLGPPPGVVDAPLEVVDRFLG